MNIRFKKWLPSKWFLKLDNKHRKNIIAGISQLRCRFSYFFVSNGVQRGLPPSFFTISPIYALNAVRQQFAFEFELDNGSFDFGFFLLTWRHFVRNCAHGNCLICGQFCFARCLAPLWPQRQQKQQQQQQQELGQLFNCLNRHLQRFLAKTSCSFWFVFFFFCLFWKIGSQLANLFAILRTCFVRFDFVAIVCYILYLFCFSIIIKFKAMRICLRRLCITLKVSIAQLITPKITHFSYVCRRYL